MEIQDYKGIYVFAERRRGHIERVAYELLGKARELAEGRGETVYAILLGENIRDEECQQLISHGADVVLVVDDRDLAGYTTEPYAQAITHIINEYKPAVVLFGATTIGRDLGPRLSARNTTGLTADCTGLEFSEEGNLLMTRPAFGGNLMATIVCPNHRPQMSTVRPGVMRRMAADPNRSGEVMRIKVPFDRSKFVVKIVEEVIQTKTKTDITEANILVSGGRGVGSVEGFETLYELADAIKGQVSASRAMVDAGVITHDRQVGQTGKTVRPGAYFALGISGAIQHLAGMEESEYIIAVNKDKESPIFTVADLGIVGDLHQVIPLVTKKLKALREEQAQA